VLHTEQPVGTPAEQEYDRKSLWVTPMGATLGRGRLSASLGPREFYNTVGRQDYAESSEVRRNARTGMIIAGTVAAVGGLAVSIGAGFVDPIPSGSFGLFHPCNSGCKTMVGVGIPVMVVGVAFAVGGGLLKHKPTSYEEDMALTRDYNRKLRERLKLPEGE
jgi:hypothetical protein